MIQILKSEYFFWGDKLLKKYSHVNQITITSFLDRGIGNFMGKYSEQQHAEVFGV